METTPLLETYVVGVDGSDESVAALAFAIRLANRSHAALTVLFAWQSPFIYRAAWRSEWDPSMTAGRLLEEAVEKAAVGCDVRPPITFVFREGSPSGALLEVSKGATLLIVGGRGKGGFAGLLLGSVSAACAQYATCPTLVVRAPFPAEGAKFVVGIDGSAASVAVMKYAARLAELTAANLRVVCAWHTQALIEPIPVPTPWTPEGDAHQIIADAVRAVFGDDVPDWVTSAAPKGHPAQVLVEESMNADLVIVGSRGHGGFAGLVLGSVSAACAERATSSVLVVH